MLGSVSSVPYNVQLLVCPQPFLMIISPLCWLCLSFLTVHLLPRCFIIIYFHIELCYKVDADLSHKLLPSTCFEITIRLTTTQVTQNNVKQISSHTIQKYFCCGKDFKLWSTHKNNSYIICYIHTNMEL